MIKIITDVKQIFKTNEDLNLATGYNKKVVKIFGITLYKREDYFENDFSTDTTVSNKKTGFAKS